MSKNFYQLIVLVLKMSMARFLNGVKNSENRNIQWNVTPICTRSFALFLFKSLNNEAQFKIITVPKLQAWITSSVPEINIFEASFIPDKDTICVE